MDGPWALIKQMYWNGVSWVSGYWINEKAGWVPKFYDDR